MNSPYNFEKYEPPKTSASKLREILKERKLSRQIKLLRISSLLVFAAFVLFAIFIVHDSLVISVMSIFAAAITVIGSCVITVVFRRFGYSFEKG